MFVIVKKKFFVLFNSFKLGFCIFAQNYRSDDFYRKVIYSLYKSKGKIYIDDDKLNMLWKNIIVFENKDSFHFILRHFLSFFEKSIVLKIFKIIGISCIILGITFSAENVDCKYLDLIRCFGFLYTIYNFISWLFKVIIMFSRLFSLFNNDFKLWSVLDSKTEKIFFVLGILTHLLLDLVFILASLLLQCLIVDLYFNNMFGNKFFNIERVISESMKDSNGQKDGFKSLFDKVLVMFAVFWFFKSIGF